MTILGILPIPELKSDAESSKNHPNEEVKAALDETLGKPQNIEIDETENGAHEEHDIDFKIEDKNNPRGNLDDGFDPENGNVVNNAAEEFDGHNKAMDKKARNEEMELEIGNRPAVKDKLNDEIAGDHGKEPDGYPELEDLHMIEGQQEENDDLGDGEKSFANFQEAFLIFLHFTVGEYDDPKAIKQGGVAERN